MVMFLLRKTVEAVITLFLAILVIFLGIRALPGDPALAMAGPDALPGQVEAIRESLGMNEPLPVQFFIYLGNLFQGDWGRSTLSGSPVIDMIARAVPVTLQLGILSLVAAVVIGIIFGVIAAVRQGKPAEWFVNVTALLGLSIPNFWLGLMLILLFAVIWPILPASGYVPFFTDPVENLRRMILPAIVLGASFAAVVMRQTRSGMLESMSADYIRTAKAKGLNPRHVVFRHALRNSLIVVVTIVGLQLGGLIGGSVIAETVFVIPGVGKLTIDAVVTRDYPLIQAVVFAAAAAYIVINLVTDIVYSLVDPRIRVTGRTG